MSYRTFKRLLGETSLERKCRWLLGSGTFVLMSASFLIYARQTEGLAYDQLTHTGRALVPSVVAAAHGTNRLELQNSLESFRQSTTRSWPETLQGYTARLVPTRSDKPEDQAILVNFRNEPADGAGSTPPPARLEDTLPRPEESAFLYYGAVRAGPSCVACHRDAARLRTFLGEANDAPNRATRIADPNLQAGDLMGVVSVRLSTAMIESGFHQNRAWLITFAVGTTLLILAGGYLVIRYVVVQPVKHLKAVSEAIAAGQTSVRSQIHTGDEFEDLSVAYNRMLTNLIQVQTRNRNLIQDLDRKVDELARANLELFQSNKTKTEFLSTMSHELRTPLNHVIGFSENLLQADNLTEKQHRFTANIHSAGQLLLSLINDVLDLAKTEAGEMRPRPSVFDPATLAEQMGTLFRPQAERKNIELLVCCAEKLPEARQDAGKLRQILSNLLSNAVKFTPEGGRVTLSASLNHADRLSFTVTDTGVGIIPEEQEVVFEKFRQASNPLTREQTGTGLGLSIVREMTKLLGGEVMLQSVLGRGSTFVVTVPLVLPDDPLSAFQPPAALAGELR